MGGGGDNLVHQAQLKRATALFKAGGRAPGLPAVFLFTDPDRLPNPLPYLARLPAGGALVYRPFATPDRTEMARRLAAACREARVTFLIGADWRLAGQVRADGVHLPSRMAGLAHGLKRGRPDWLVSVAVHRARELSRATGADLVVLSPLRPTRSSAARQPLGLGRAAALARRAGVPAIALGGVGPAQARRLAQAGFAGFAGIDWVFAAPL